MSFLLAKSTSIKLHAVTQNPGKSWLFYGPAHVGKFSLAKEISTKWNSRPESTNVIYGTPKIGIDAIHDIRRSLSLKTASGWQTVIINGGDHMTSEAQNALLKILEEPPSYTSIILIAENLQKLAPTILSRTQKVRFLPSDTLEISKLVSKKFSLEKSTSNRVANHSHGLPGMAVRIASDKTVLLKMEALSNLINRYINGSLYEKLKTTEQILKDIDIKLFVKNLVEKLNEEKESYSAGSIVNILRSAERAITQLDANANKKLVLYHLSYEVSK